MKKILYPARIENNNLGDVLINSLLVRELSKNAKVYLKGMPSNDFLELLTHENPFSSNIKVLDFNTSTTAIYKISVLKFLALSKERIDYSFETPGHLLKRNQPLKSFIKYFFDVWKVLVYRAFGVKYIMMGVTLGPFRTGEWRLMSLINKLSHFTIVRDKVNFKSLKDRGFNVQYLPDLAYLLHKNTVTEHYASLRESFDVIVSLRGNIHGKQLDADYLRQQILKVGSLISNKPEYNKILISYQVEADEESSLIVFDSLIKEYPNKNIRLETVQLDFANAVSVYSNAGIIITNRLHVYLFGLCLGTKAVITTEENFHKKIVDIVKDLGLPETLFSHYTDDSNLQIGEKFSIAADQNSNEIKNFINKICQ